MKKEEKYKYKIGDKVRFKIIEMKEKTCQCCGHIEEEFYDVKKVGIIRARYYDLVIREQSIMDDKIKKELDGTIVHSPVISNIRPCRKEPCYNIYCGKSIFIKAETEIKLYK